jgi:hypothetical protein
MISDLKQYQPAWRPDTDSRTDAESQTQDVRRDVLHGQLNWCGGALPSLPQRTGGETLSYS